MAVACAHLPGGLVIEGKRERVVAYHELTGWVEKAIAARNGEDENTPARVTRQLCAACATIGGRPFSPDLARALCVADRQVLMLKLTTMMTSETRWVQPVCPACGEVYDLEVPCGGLYVKESGPSFPEAEVRVGGRLLRVRVPTGGDEEAISDLEDRDALRTLLRACVVSVAGQAPSAALLDGLDEEELDTIDGAIDSMAPSISTSIAVNCPACRTAQVVEVDPYSLCDSAIESLFEEVHYIALYYHWSEREVLDLPRERRRLYISLIDRSRSMVSSTSRTP